MNKPFLTFPSFFYSTILDLIFFSVTVVSYNKMKEMAKSNGKIVTIEVESCYNCSGKICYNVTNFSTTVITTFHYSCNNFPPEL